jgi:hypothetical protein
MVISEPEGQHSGFQIKAGLTHPVWEMVEWSWLPEFTFLPFWYSGRFYDKRGRSSWHRIFQFAGEKG